MQSKRIVYFDLLNVLATFCVVFLHANSRVHTFENTLAWKQALGVEVLCYWAVPVFFMLSGATLINYRQRYSTKEFFLKRFSRILIPFVFWTVFYAVLYRINPLEIGLLEFLNRCMNTQILSIFWFFIPLISVYLAMPVISLLKDHRRVLWYMAGLGFLLTSFLPQIFGYVGLTWNPGIAPLACGGFLLFCILGFLLSQTEISRPKRWLFYGLGLASVLLRYIATLLLSLRDGVLNQTFFDYLQYHSVFLAVSVFVFFKHSKLVARLAEKPRVAKMLQTLSGLSFGVYLIHYVLIHFLSQYIDPNTYFWRLGMPSSFISCLRVWSFF